MIKSKSNQCYRFGGFYLMLKSGVDIVGVLEALGTSERILNFLRNSDAGYYALSYACYKIATPARYAVTVGGTTIGTYIDCRIFYCVSDMIFLAIAKLKNTGYLKSTSEMANKLKSTKQNLKEGKEKLKDDLENKFSK